MKTRQLSLERRLRAWAVTIWMSACWQACAATVHYVDVNSTNPTPPYTNWATAAVTIQDAVDAAGLGEQVLVADGVYATGAVAALGSNSNRVSILKPIIVQSVNGPAVTIIEGCQVPGMTNGDGAIRCVALGSRAVLSGFTLTKGATQGGGGPYDCGGGLYIASGSPSSSVVSNCVLRGNSASYRGGGVYDPNASALLIDCTLTSNSAIEGGGAYGGELERCIICSNSASAGGGVAVSSASSCSMFGNSAVEGGAAYAQTGSTCVLDGCTIVGNQAEHAGGASGARLYNCIVYFNTSRGYDPNYFGGTLRYCCTMPVPTNGDGNFAADPQLASVSHLSATSPCRDAGLTRVPPGTDIDGEAWRTPPSVGCDEYWPGAVTGPLAVAMSASYSNVTPGFGVDLTALIDGRTTMSYWDFGDGATLTNQPYASHSWPFPGDYAVVLTAFNESHPEGVQASCAVQVRAPQVHYVGLDSTNPVPPYLSWETAAADIQSAVDAATTVGAVVVVGDGVYASGGRAVTGTMTNRVTIDRPITVQSLHGPVATVVQGFQVPTTNGNGAIRCVYLADQAVLSGFTLTNGATRTMGDLEGEQKGGGVWCASGRAVVTNCVLSGNAASMRGGGAWLGRLNHCLVTGNVCQNGAGCYGSAVQNSILSANRASQYGGGAFGGWLLNCLVVSNSASIGGGACQSILENCVAAANSATIDSGASLSTLNNCTVVGNSGNSGAATSGVLNNCIVYSNSPANYSSATLNYCCTMPMPAGGMGNFTSDPGLLDCSGNDFHLASGSPCINAGRNASDSTSTDFDGNERILGGTVDVGAYEFQAPSSVISYAWLQAYDLPTDGSADFVDSDSDGMNNWQEWRCQTVPTNALSALRMVSAAQAGTNVTITWESVPGVSYFLERSTDATAFSPFQLAAANVVGQPGTTTHVDTNAASYSPLFYRVGVGQ